MSRYTGSADASPANRHHQQFPSARSLRNLSIMVQLASEMPPPLRDFAERLGEIGGDVRARQIIGSMREPKRAGYWVNPLREGQPLADSTPVPELEGCWSVVAGQRDRLMADQRVIDGTVYPMNPSSVLAVRAVVPRSHEEILDLAAAPGGKTLLMSADMNNGGRIAAVEPVRGRFHRLRANLVRCGVTNVECYLSDGRGIGRKVPERFDAVLLDAPCSSEARIRVDDPESYGHWKVRKIRESARKQKALLRSAFAALKPGGRLIYCTCSFAPEENELPVNDLLQAEPAAKLRAVDPICPNYLTGLTSWRGKALDPTLCRAVRVLPDDLWDGFFFCRIEKAPA